MTEAERLLEQCDAAAKVQKAVNEHAEALANYQRAQKVATDLENSLRSQEKLVEYLGAKCQELYSKVDKLRRINKRVQSSSPSETQDTKLPSSDRIKELKRILSREFPEEDDYICTMAGVGGGEVLALLNFYINRIQSNV